MHDSVSNRSRKRFTLRTYVCCSVLGGILIGASVGPDLGERLSAHAQTAKAEPKAASKVTSGIEETRTLIRDLELQLENQRDQLEKTETGLRRAAIAADGS